MPTAALVPRWAEVCACTAGTTTRQTRHAMTETFTGHHSICGRRTNQSSRTACLGACVADGFGDATGFNLDPRHLRREGARTQVAVSHRCGDWPCVAF